MKVISTRNAAKSVSSADAVLAGIADDGGLFVPEYFPRIDLQKAARRGSEGYARLAAYVMSLFFDLGEEELLHITTEAYAGYDDENIVPLRELTGDEYVMELFHGPTLAFKDMALQVLPRLISAALELRGGRQDVLVLTATSGDTGKAALEGFRDVPRTAIEVFYPAEGVSALQKLQMVTQDGRNTDVCAVRGNFDDAQTGVKQLFMDAGFRRKVSDAGYMLSSANSINIGRLVPQVAYYVWAYVQLVASGRIEQGEKVNFCVPTGNFGNILAAYYAHRCGLPVGRLICASNKNNILTDFFQKGGYDTRRTFYKTMSPSMDILVSSNLERLLFEISERDEQAVVGWMQSLANDGRYEIPPHARNELRTLFYADFCSEEETAAAIKKTFDDFGYLIDTHTAVAQCVYGKYVGDTADTGVTVVVSTANPYKFTQDVLRAVGGRDIDDAFAAAEKLEQMTGVPVPARISELKMRPVLHDQEVEVSGQAAAVYGFVERIKEWGDA